MTETKRPRREHRLLVGSYAFVARTILPRRFREECGESLVETFSDTLRDASTQPGRLGKVVVCGEEFLGLLFAAIRERGRAVRAPRPSQTTGSATNRKFDMTWLPREFRHILRALARTPGVTLSAVLALALGIGATTTMFSVSHGLLRDLPFEEADHLVWLGIDPDPDRGFDLFRMSVHEIVDWREQQSTLESLEAYSMVSMNLSGLGEDPERVRGARVTAKAFDALRVLPMFGRGFRAEEELPGAEPVVVISNRLWEDRYGLDPAVLGQTVRVNGVQRTVVGVMPEGFHFPEFQNIWIPLVLDQTAVERGDGHTLFGFGRLKNENTLEDVRVEYTALSRRLELGYPDIYGGARIRAVQLKHDFAEIDTILIMNVMVGVVSFVLIIACANVANLLLARAASRSREVAVRTALGASRARVMGQMLVESLVISIIGGFLGISLAYVGVQAFSAPLVPLLPFYWMDVRVDGTVLLFTGALVLASSVIAGTAPALKVTGVNVSTVLKDQALGVAGLRLGRFSSMLVIGQVALSCGLLTVSGLMMKGALLTTESDLSFATTDVLTARLTLLESDYPEEGDRDRFYRELVSRLEGLQGVSAAAVTSHLPGVERTDWRVQLEGTTFDSYRELPRTRMATVSPEFFGALDVGLIEGRGFNADDNADGQPVTIVNRRFAERFFPGESPLGHQIRTATSRSVGDWMTIVGVAPEMAMNRRIAAASDGVYVPYSQRVQRSMSLVVHARIEPVALVPAVREVVASLDPHLPIYDVSSLSDRISTETIPERMFSALFICCGAAALILAVVGLYGVMAFTVRRRTKEIGIRMALGARGQRILWISFRGGFIQLIIGLVAGICIAAIIAPTMQDLFSEASPWDWQIYLTIAVALCFSGVVASIVPALRATRVDPMETLRCE